MEIQSIKNRGGRVELVVSTKDTESAIILYCRGRIVFKREGDKLFNQVTDLLQQGRHVILEMHGVNAVDSGGLGCIVLMDAGARALGVQLRYCNLSRRVREMFALTNLAKVLPVYDSEEEALRGLENKAPPYALGA